MKYYLITASGFYSDDSGSFTITEYIAQDCEVFHYAAYRQTVVDAHGKGDDDLYVVIYFLREVTQLEFEINKHDPESANTQ